MTDEELVAQRLEMQIETTRQALEGAHTEAIRADLKRELDRLLGQRSPWMIAKMETEKGL